MKKKSLDHFGKLQRSVIDVIWELGEASVREVWKRLCRNKELAYTTVLTAMQRLEKDGWLRHRTEGNKNIYMPTRTRAQAGIKSVHKLIERVFDGNSFLLFRQLMDEDQLSNEELKELEKLIAQKRKEKQK